MMSGASVASFSGGGALLPDDAFSKINNHHGHKGLVVYGAVTEQLVLLQ